MIGVGDLVVCVGDDTLPWAVVDGPDDGTASGPKKGDIHRVVHARVAPYDGELELMFAPWPRDYFPASDFRKIQHDKREACESEFVKLLNRVKQGERA